MWYNTHDKTERRSQSAGGEASADGVGDHAITSIPKVYHCERRHGNQFVSNVTSSKYKLFQVADMICAIELARLKLLHIGHISDSEKDFFMGIGNFRKNYLKPILRKEA